MLSFLFLKLPYQMTLKKRDVSFDHLLGASIMFIIPIEEKKNPLRQYPEKEAGRILSAYCDHQNWNLEFDLFQWLEGILLLW